MLINLFTNHPFYWPHSINGSKFWDPNVGCEITFLKLTFSHVLLSIVSHPLGLSIPRGTPFQTGLNKKGQNNSCVNDIVPYKILPNFLLDSNIFFWIQCIMMHRKAIRHNHVIGSIKWSTQQIVFMVNVYQYQLQWLIRSEDSCF